MRPKKLRIGAVGSVLVAIVLGVLIIPLFSQEMRRSVVKTGTDISLKGPQDYYQQFQCQCCGKPIDTNCCGMAKQGKERVDELLLSVDTEEELMTEMVKSFGYGVLMYEGDGQVVRDYLQSNADSNPPAIRIVEDRYDFGTIVQQQEKISTTFTIENSGKSDLIIENLDTSCMCTTAQLIFNGKDGPVFGMSMHGNNPTGYSLAIPAGESAELRVMYDPMAHGPQKKPSQRLVRIVTITSNDPIDFQKEVRIELTQVAFGGA